VNGYLLDTDIIIEIIKGSVPLSDRLIIVQQAGAPVYLHALSYYETKRGLLRASATKQLNAFEKLCQSLPIISLTQESLDISAQIYAELSIQGQIIGDADILIAGTAIAMDLTVVTRNLHHYERIPNLQITDWSD